MIAPFEYSLMTAFDGQGTRYQTNLCKWFYFGVNFKNTGIYTFNILEAGKQSKLLREGLKPVFRVGEEGRWNVVTCDISNIFDQERNISFTFTFEVHSELSSTVYFAYSVPWSYTQNLVEIIH